MSVPTDDFSNLWRWKVKKKVSLYVEPAQLRLIDDIADIVSQKRSVVLREAVHIYVACFLKSRKGEKR